MATNTTNYGWTKPSYEDAADIEVINGTIDNIDAQVKTVENAIPTTLAELTDDTTHRTVSDTEKATWNAKADVADIPTVPITAIQKNGIDVTPVSGTVNIIVPTTAADVSALPDTTKYATALSLTINSSTFVMTGQLKDQNGDNLGTAQTIDLPLESVVVNGSYNNTTKKVVLTLQNGNTIEFSVADLVAGLQTELSTSNKLNPAFINYDSTHRAVSDAEKTAWNNKANSSAIPSASSASPKMDGTASSGSSSYWSRADHVHPTDTSRQAAATTKYTMASIGTSYTLVDALTQTISPGQVCRFTAMSMYNGSSPTGVIISRSNDASLFENQGQLIAKNEKTGHVALTASGLWGNYSSSSQNIYVWIKNAGTGTNRMFSIKETLGTF